MRFCPRPGYEHYRVLIDDTSLWSKFVRLLQRFARADVPQRIAEALRLGRMTALQKDNGRVRLSPQLGTRPPHRVTPCQEGED